MNFYNLYEFMNMLSFYATENSKSVHENFNILIKGLKFVFPCTMRQKAELANLRIFGTGGKTLVKKKRIFF